MRVRFLTATAVIASSVVATTVLVQCLSTSSAQAAGKSRYLPEYTADGDLILPKNFHEWSSSDRPSPPTLGARSFPWPNIDISCPLVAFACGQPRSI
jgi:hypothetical protein